MMKEQPCVLIESPYAGDVEANIRYLWECCHHSMNDLREVPFAAHGFYTQFLNDEEELERAAGMLAGRAWAHVADKVVFYIDLGFSPGMEAMQRYCHEQHIPYEIRHLPPERLRQWKTQSSSPQQSSCSS